MKILKTLDALIIGVLVSFTAGVLLVEHKSNVLGPYLGRCPQAISGLTSMLTALNVSAETPVAVMDCGIGVMFYLLLPGLGLGWFVTKYILKH